MSENEEKLTENEEPACQKGCKGKHGGPSKKDGKILEPCRKAGRCKKDHEAPEKGDKVVRRCCTCSKVIEEDDYKKESAVNDEEGEIDESPLPRKEDRSDAEERERQIIVCPCINYDTITDKKEPVDSGIESTPPAEEDEGDTADDLENKSIEEGRRCESVFKRWSKLITSKKRHSSENNAASGSSRKRSSSTEKEDEEPQALTESLKIEISDAELVTALLKWRNKKRD